MKEAIEARRFPWRKIIFRVGVGGLALGGVIIGSAAFDQSQSAEAGPSSTPVPIRPLPTPAPSPTATSTPDAAATQTANARATVIAAEERLREQERLKDIYQQQTAVAQRLDALLAPPTHTATSTATSTSTVTATPKATSTPTLPPANATQTADANRMIGIGQEQAIGKGTATAERGLTVTAEAQKAATAEARQTATAQIRDSQRRGEFPWGLLIVGTGIALIAGLALATYHAPTRTWVRASVRDIRVGAGRGWARIRTTFHF